MAGTIIICVLIMIIISLALNLIDLLTKKDKGCMSFKESLDLADLPIVTFINNGKKLNFLLDTGASASHINKSILSGLVYTHTNLSMDIIGMEGNPVSTEFCDIEIEYKGKKFGDTFGVSDLEEAFSSVKQSTGVQIHGILGNGFFQKYQYVIDFNELVAYPKK